MLRGVAWLVCAALSLGVGAVAAYPWADPRFSYLVDDGLSHVLRQFVFDHLIRREPLSYPRWWPDLALGYGTPLLNFYSPGVYYLTESLVRISGDIYQSLRWTGVASIALGASGSFMLGARVTRHPLGALLTAVAYVGSPYPFVTNLYLRSAFPEALGQGLLPWTLLGALLAVGGRRARSSLVLALGVAVTVLVHSLSALILCGALLAWIPGIILGLERGARAGAARRAAAGIGLGLLIAAFFWVPALSERSAVHSELGTQGNLNPQRSLFDPFGTDVTLQDMAAPQSYDVTRGTPIDLHWTYPHATLGVPGPPKPSLAQGLLATVSLLVLGGALMSDRSNTVLSGALAAPDRRLLWAAGTCGVIAAGAYALQTTWSASVWRNAPLLWTLQFPWRLLSVLSLALALGSACVFAWLGRRRQQQWLLALLLGAFVAVNGLASRAHPDRFGDPSPEWRWSDLLRNYWPDRVWAGTLTGGEFVPRSVTLPDESDVPRGGAPAYEGAFPSGGWIAGKVWPYSGAVDIAQVWGGVRWTETQVTAHDPGVARIAFKTLAFPGVRVYLDGRPAAYETPPFDPVAELGYGFVVVAVPSGSHRVQVAFEDTPSRLIGTGASIVGLAVLAALVLPSVGPSLWLMSRPFAAVKLAALAVGAAVVAVVCARYVVAASRSPYAATSLNTAIVANLLDGSRVRLSGPGGAGPGPFAGARDVVIDGHARRWLYMHPPSEGRIELVVPPRAVFQAGLALDEGAWDAAGADGVVFQLEVIDAAGRVHRLLEEVVQPQTRSADRGWRFAQVDLGAFAGETVTLVLRTVGRDTPDYDWAGWGTPVVYVDRSALYPPAPGVAPARRRVP